MPQERIQERIPRSSADHGGNRRGDSARVPGDTDGGLPCATVHGRNCGKRADHTTGARAESRGQIVDVPTPQIQEEIAAVIQLIPQERVSERIIEQTRCSSPSDSRPKSTYCRQSSIRLHSAHTGSMLPTTLWGKSPCEVAESVIRRPQNTSLWTGSEAECRDAVCVGVLRNNTVMP